ncbi:hypothetical protein HY522_06450 [bacterium]|nr:hypothetical protein [bacterium]
MSGMTDGMEKFQKLLVRSRLWIIGAVFLGIAVYLLPHILYFSWRPAILLTESAVRDIQAMPAVARKRMAERIRQKNVQGVAVPELTLADLEASGNAFVASGNDLLRIFKIQSIASYYVFEQVRDKNLKNDGSYIFFSESALFEAVHTALKSRLDQGEIAVYERGIFRADASFPDNFILESSVPPGRIRDMPLGWVMPPAAGALSALTELTGESTYRAVLHPASPASRTDTGYFVIHEPYLRFPCRSIRIIDDPLDLIHARRGASLQSVFAVPVASPDACLAVAGLLVLLALLSFVQWTVWAPAVAAGFVVLTLAILPAQINWAALGMAFLLPPAGLILWVAASDTGRLRAHPVWGSAKFGGRFLGVLFLSALVPGWLISSLAWQFPHLQIGRYAFFGNLLLPFISTGLFLAVWSIEASNRSLYLRHVRMGLELAMAAVVLAAPVSPGIVCVAAVCAWARWMVLLERARLRAQEDSPGIWAVFFISGALGLKLFLTVSPVYASLLNLSGVILAAFIGRAWMLRTHRGI